jgi:hypothetical protein
MTQAFDQAQRQIMVLNEALSSVVMIAWANARNNGNACEDFSARTDMLADGEVTGRDEYALSQPREAPVHRLWG